MMFIYLGYLLTLSALYLFIRVEGHKVVGSQLSLRYQRWRSLNSLVSTQHKTAWAVFYHSLILLCNVLYKSFLQYMNTTVVKIGRNKFKVTYVVSGKMYTMLVTPIRGPPPILQIINDNAEDVTDDVLPYMGPRYDWHGSDFDFSTTFNSTELTFNLDSGDCMSCSNSSQFLTDWKKEN